MAKESQRRGQLTTRVQDKAKELFGREITVTELRLMPYAAHVAQNDRYIDQRRVNDDDREILDTWGEEGRVVHNNPARFVMTKDFWDAINEIVWLAYCDLSGD